MTPEQIAMLALVYFTGVLAMSLAWFDACRRTRDLVAVSLLWPLLPALAMCRAISAAMDAEGEGQG